MKNIKKSHIMQAMLQMGKKTFINQKKKFISYNTVCSWLQIKEHLKKPKELHIKKRCLGSLSQTFPKDNEKLFHPFGTLSQRLMKNFPPLGTLSP